MALSNLINPVNKINNICYAKKLSFQGKESSSKEKDKVYYTYYTGNDPTLKKELMIAGGAFGGLSVLFSYGFSKIFEKFAKKKPAKWISILEGCVLALATVGIALNMVIKSRTKNLKPISKEEQIQKEQKIKAMVEDLAKQKGVELNGFCFYDYRQTDRQTLTLGHFDISTGYLVLNSKFRDTDLDIKESIPLIIHELTHAKQFENIARAKDGLYDYNRISVITGAKSLKDDEKKELLNARDEDIPALAKRNLHNPKEFFLLNEELDLKNEINELKAMKMYLNNPNVSKYDLPMTVSEEYYNRITRDKGPLSPEETKKVKSYLEYMEKNISINAKEGEIGKSIETTKKYFSDPMEIEAYKAQNEYIKTGKIT